MKFAFNLDFDELQEELQEQKIDEYLTHLYNEDSFYFAENQRVSEDPVVPTLEEVLENQDERDDRYPLN